MKSICTILLVFPFQQDNKILFVLKFHEIFFFCCSLEQIDIKLSIKHQQIGMKQNLHTDQAILILVKLNQIVIIAQLWLNFTRPRIDLFVYGLSTCRNLKVNKPCYWLKKGKQTRLINSRVCLPKVWYKGSTCRKSYCIWWYQHYISLMGKFNYCISF